MEVRGWERSSDSALGVRWSSMPLWETALQPSEVVVVEADGVVLRSLSCPRSTRL